jgi:Tfp pilus assembly protein PilE
MGCLFVIVLSGLSAATIHFAGYALWAVVLLAFLWLAAAVVSALFGHRGFGGQGNTDLMIVIAGAAITAAIVLPNYNAQKPCNQAKAALRNLADAEYEYFANHKAFTTDLNSLNLTQKPDVYIMIIKGDEQSFTATASHRLCKKDKDGTPEVYMWDSARGGLP